MEGHAKGKKRKAENDAVEFGGEMQKLFTSFGADVSKNLETKRKRLESLTQSSFETNNKKIDDLWKVQLLERSKLNQEFKKQVTHVFDQWDGDVKKSKDSEEKLQEMFRQQQKMYQQQRIVQSQRLRTVKQLHQQYLKGMEDLEQCHKEQQANMHTELKKEMVLLQKKILMDTHHQEISNVRKSLQSMLAEI